MAEAAAFRHADGEVADTFGGVGAPVVDGDEGFHAAKMVLGVAPLPGLDPTD